MTNFLAEDDNGSIQAPKSISYLVRLERMHQSIRDCVLLRGDGEYHFEREVGLGSTHISEGSLTAEELQELVRIVSSDELFLLSQEKIMNPLVSGNADELIVNVRRPGYWQNLTFVYPESREPYRRSLDPLLQWLDSLHKGKRLWLTEEAARTNCKPPEKITLKTRPDPKVKTDASPLASSSASPNPTNSPSFALLFVAKHFANFRVENTCVVIYPEGKYHLERKAQRISENKPTMSIFEGSAGKEAMQELRTVLDDPQLQSKGDPPREIGGVEWDITSLRIQRSSGIQQLMFWRYTPFAPKLGTKMPVQDNGTKLLGPLQQWLKTNVQATKSTLLQNIDPSNCRP